MNPFTRPRADFPAPWRKEQKRRAQRCKPPYRSLEWNRRVRNNWFYCRSL